MDIKYGAVGIVKEHSMVFLSLHVDRFHIEKISLAVVELTNALRIHQHVNGVTRLFVLKLWV